MARPIFDLGSGVASMMGVDATDVLQRVLVDSSGRTLSIVSGTQSGGTVSPILVDSAGRVIIGARRAATYVGSTTITPAATPTDIFLIAGPSSGNPIEVYGFRISAVSGGAAIAFVAARWIKRSADNTGGTRVAVTAVPYLSTDSAARATIFRYTANPAGLGATVGDVWTEWIVIPSATASPVAPVEYWFTGRDPDDLRPVTLRSTAEVLAFNLGGTGMPAATQFAITAILEEP